MFYILINFVIDLIINQFVIDVLHDGLINQSIFQIPTQFGSGSKRAER